MDVGKKVNVLVTVAMLAMLMVSCKYGNQRDNEILIPSEQVTTENLKETTNYQTETKPSTEKAETGEEAIQPTDVDSAAPTKETCNNNEDTEPTENIATETTNPNDNPREEAPNPGGEGTRTEEEEL